MVTTTWRVTSPKGKSHEGHVLTRLCREHKLLYHKLLSDGQWNGWTLTRIDDGAAPSSQIAQQRRRDEAIDHLLTAEQDRQDRLVKSQATGEYYRALSMRYSGDTARPKRPEHLGPE